MTKQSIDMKKIIYGPPGTGKTTRLLSVVDSLLNDGFNPVEIGFIAFTRKAANEARSRAQEKFKLSSEQLPWFRTLHSLAFQQLGMNRSGVMGIQDYLKICGVLGLSITTKGLSEDGTLLGLSKGDRLFFMENMSRAMMKTPKDHWEDQQEEDIGWFEFEQLHLTLDGYKKHFGKKDFTDIIYEFIDRGINPPVKVLIVDEAQDLSPLQWKMVEKLESTVEEVYIAGDDDQAIFRWAGADVDHFIGLEGEREVLHESYRCPLQVQELAGSIADKIENRVKKNWRPREAEGTVQRLGDLESINMASGTWLLLARNSYLLNLFNEYCVQSGYIFESSIGSPISRSTVNGIRSWERLREGKYVTALEVSGVFDLMTTKVGVAYGMKTLIEKTPENKLLNIQDLRKDYGLLTDKVWHEALDKIPPTEAEYFISALKNGEKIGQDPRIKISTIHSVKGGEADNVVLLTDMAQRTFQEFQDNPDDEHRVWYVAVTRARENLYIVEPTTDRCYEI